MTTTAYSGALDLALTALRDGEDLDAVLARFPEHRESLRHDLRLGAALGLYAQASPEPRDEAIYIAAGRLQAQLESARGARLARTATWPGLPLRRVAWAGALAAITAAILVLVSLQGNGNVESATLEGIVLENSGGSLMVQTLDALERIAVPTNVEVADADGMGIGLADIAVGEVVVLDVERSGEGVAALRIQRLVTSIDDWCAASSQRCSVLADRLGQAPQPCDRDHDSCRSLIERVENLRVRALFLAHLEDLKTQCRAGSEEACRQIVNFCSQSDVCGSLPPVPQTQPEAQDPRERMLNLYRDCRQGDEAACRQLAGACATRPDLCPEGLTLPPLDSSPQREPDNRPAVPPPTATPPPKLEATRVNEPEPSATPARDDSQPTRR